MICITLLFFITALFQSLPVFDTINKDDIKIMDSIGTSINTLHCSLQNKLSYNSPVSKLTGLSGISRQEDAHISPSPPGNITIHSVTGKTIIQWQGIGLDNIRHYRIYQQCHDESWQSIKDVIAKDPADGVYAVTLPYRQNCIYSISVVDNYDNEGSKSESIKP